MLHTVTFRLLAVAACGWLLALDASALVLGRARGAVLIGRPLDVSIPATLAASDSDDPCADAELFYGEQKVGRAPSVRWEPGPNREGAIRITSAVPVDEPMVTLYLKVGCTQPVTRRYVMLSEPPPASEASTLPGGPRASAAAPRPAPAQAAPVPRETTPAATPRERVAAAPAAVPRVGAEPARPAAGRAARPARPAAAAPAPAPARQPASRLRLDPAELLVERDPTLRLSPALAGTVNEQGRSLAAALWKALQRTPEEILREGQRLEAIDREMQALRAQTQQNAAALAQMRTQVESARSERNQASFLSAALLAVLAVLAGWLVWRWRRSARDAERGRWFEPAGTPAPGMPAGPSPEESAALAAVVAAGAAATRSGQAAAPAAMTQTQPLFRPQAAAWMPSEGGEFQASQGGTMRLVGVQEVLDVQDKVDFFLSIGQPDQAVALLEAHVHDQVETSALPFMDLLDLYHSLGKKPEYERLRLQFIQRFSAQVPDFEHFDQPTQSLENYGRALSRIVALWPSRRVLSVIEESIFRKPGLPGAEPFSLEAYRELVLLYHIAREVAPPQDSISLQGRSGDFTATAMQPLNMPEGASSAAATLAPSDGALSVDVPLEDDGDRDLLLIPPSSPRIGVDIDLEASVSQPSSRPELPPLDFDTSLFDDVDGGRKNR